MNYGGLIDEGVLATETRLRSPVIVFGEESEGEGSAKNIGVR